MIELNSLEIITRLIATVFASGLIGYEREKKGHSAGLRTHILVAVGACLLSLIQLQATYQAISLAESSEAIASVLSTDMTRITAQVVSGIGFLGAGTIIMTKSHIRGLTTAASIWTSAAIGIGLGMGYYFIVGVSTVITLIILTILKRVFRPPLSISFEVIYSDQPELSGRIYDFFNSRSLKVLESHYYYQVSGGVITHRNHYSIDMSNVKSRSMIFEELIKIGQIDEIRSLNIEDIAS